MIIHYDKSGIKIMEKKSRILVVDDNDSVRQLLQKMLETLGYEVETASDGFEALSKLVFDIDLILLDILMPGMDGCTETS